MQRQNSDVSTCIFSTQNFQNSLSGQVFGKREWGKVWELFRFCESFELSNLEQSEAGYFVKLGVSWNIPPCNLRRCLYKRDALIGFFNFVTECKTVLCKL